MQYIVGCLNIILFSDSFHKDMIKQNLGMGLAVKEQDIDPFVELFGFNYAPKVCIQFNHT